MNNSDPAGSPRNASEIVSDLLQDPIMHKLLGDVLDGHPVRDLLLSHRDQLFYPVIEGKTTIHIRYLFLDNLPAEDSAHMALARPVEQATEMQRIKTDMLTESITRKFESLGQDLQATACLLLVRFLQKNPTVLSLTELESATLPDVLKALGTEKFSFDVFHEFESFMKDEEHPGGDIVLRQKIVSNVAMFQRQIPVIARDLFQAANVVPLLITPINMAGRYQWRKLIDILGKNRGEYAAILEHLCALGLAKSTSQTFWCDRAHDQTYILTSTAPLRPHELQLQCPRCKGEMCASMTFTLHPLIEEAIYSKDGFVGVAVFWLLQRRLHLQFEHGKFSKNEECDFIVSIGNGRCLIECKMFKLGKDAESVASRIENAVVQALQHVKSLKSDGIEIGEVMIVTNIDIASSAEGVLKKMKRKIGALRLQVMHLGALEAALRLPRQTA